ncbi:hypothetical protein T492DRAFT_1000079 [Pavlovales sp. CCMP2436]|nr:hypothetical protein T492DRAFT_1000079 [Pavlovales sp. CCMP2436]
MRLTWGEGVEQSEYRFGGQQACDVESKIVLWVDLVSPALWDKGAVSAKAKWLLSGQAVDPANVNAVLASLPAPEWVESELPVLSFFLKKYPAGLDLVPPCYTVLVKAHKAAALELTLTVGLGKETDQAGIKVLALPAGGLTESPQEKLERMLRIFDAEGIRELLLAPPIATEGAPAADTEAAAEADTGAEVEEGEGEEAVDILSQISWTHSLNGENLLLLMGTLLLKHGAMPDWCGVSGRAGSATPLALAINSGNVELARLLIVEKQADVKLRTLDPNYSALVLASRGPGGLPMVRMLLTVACKALIKMSTVRLLTSALSPLTAAACIEDAVISRKIIFLLRQAGADESLPDRGGRTAIEYARRLEGPFRSGSELVISDLLAALPEPELPKYWTTAKDPDLGITYYFHVLTKEVSWQMPKHELGMVA